MESLLLAPKEIKELVGDSWCAFPLAMFDKVAQAQLDKIKDAGWVQLDENQELP